MNRPLALITAAIVGFAAAAAVTVLPTWRIEALILDSGLHSLMAAAKPPVGNTARLMLTLLASTIAASATWAAALRVLEPMRVRRTAPALRRAAAHSDAPAREPVMAARDLGTPFLEVTAKKDSALDRAEPNFAAEMPCNLDIRMAAFDTAAILPVPATPSETVAPLRRKPTLVPETTRIETDQATARSRPAPFPFRLSTALDSEPVVALETDPTIHSLLDRLEREIVRRRTGPAMSERPEADGVEDALPTLPEFAQRPAVVMGK